MVERKLLGPGNISVLPSRLYAWAGHLVRISLFNPRCQCCGNLLAYSYEKGICRECREKISPYIGPVCKKCGKTLPENLDICGDCLADPPPFRKHVSYTRYQGIMKDMIIRYKFKGAGDLKKDLADCLAELFRNEDEKNFDWIIPVPDDPGRKREYRPIQIIARRLSRQLEIPVMKNNLIKVRKTEPQVGLSQAKRLRNLDGAFRIKNPGILKKQTVLLIDDVYTTGTTVKKCSVQLEKAGARVVAMTLARSI